jgi:hypothetical protein
MFQEVCGNIGRVEDNEGRPSEVDKYNIRIYRAQMCIVSNIGAGIAERGRTIFFGPLAILFPIDPAGR